MKITSWRLSLGLARRGEDRQIGADHFSVVEVVDGQQRTYYAHSSAESDSKWSLEQSAADERRIAEELSRLPRKGTTSTHYCCSKPITIPATFFPTTFATGTLPISTPQPPQDKNVVDAIVECELFVSKWKTEQLLVELVYILRKQVVGNFLYPRRRGAPYIEYSRCSTAEA